MALAPVSGTAPAPQPGSTQDAATSAFNLNFESLLKIILTQLTYQDPLKPMDNFEFVSQLAQFSQIQIGQTGNVRLTELAAAQSTLQATSLLGRTVDVPAGSTSISGKVTSISFADGVPKITIKTSSGSTISNISMASVSQVREGN
jgi:flagellar basal-body rod modification protein FlgD